MLWLSVLYVTPGMVAWFLLLRNWTMSVCLVKKWNTQQGVRAVVLLLIHSDFLKFSFQAGCFGEHCRLSQRCDAVWCPLVQSGHYHSCWGKWMLRRNILADKSALPLLDKQAFILSFQSLPGTFKATLDMEEIGCSSSSHFNVVEKERKELHSALHPETLLKKVFWLLIWLTWSLEHLRPHCFKSVQSNVVPLSFLYLGLLQELTTYLCRSLLIYLPEFCMEVLF